MVVTSHMWNLYTRSSAMPGVSGFLTNWLENGHLWVDVFIVISGFCLMLPVTRFRTIRGGWQTFYKSRARRILPPFYAAVGFALALALLHHHHLSAALILSNLLLLQDVWPQSLLLDGPLWSVALEWKIYFLFPLFVWFWLRFGSRAVLIASGVLSLFLLALYVHLKFIPDLSLACPWYVFLFALGMVSADFTQRGEYSAKEQRQGVSGAWCALAAALALDWVMMHCSPLSSSSEQRDKVRVLLLPLSDCLVGLAVAALLFLLHHSAASQSKNTPLTFVRLLLSWRPLVFIGTFSYSIYLIHLLLVYDLGSRLIVLLHTNNPIIIIPIDVMLVLPCAYLFHLIFERPFMTKPGVKIKTEAQAEAAAVVNPAP